MECEAKMKETSPTEGLDSSWGLAPGTLRTSVPSPFKCIMGEGAEGK